MVHWHLIVIEESFYNMGGRGGGKSKSMALFSLSIGKVHWRIKVSERSKEITE